MNFKVGDKVNFLNEKGGGIISKILDNAMVQVTIDDGFDVPVMAKDLIKTGTKEISNDIERAYKRINPDPEPEPVDTDITPLFLSPNNPEQKAPGLYFAMVPDIQENPLVGSLDLYLINHSDYDLLFNIFESRSGSYHGIEYGFLQPQSRLFIKKTGRSEIEQWANALLQALFFKENKCTPQAPFSGLINFKPIRLYKEESFKYQSLLQTNAFLVDVCILSELTRKSLFEETLNKESIQMLKEKIQTNQAPKKSHQVTKTILDKHKIDDSVAEVDLHIGELVDNFSNLEKNDLLQIQLDYFKKCLIEAQKIKINKVIFIHGVGNGKLKTEIYKYLQTLEGIEFYDATYARYGMGATEVNFYKHKK